MRLLDYMKRHGLDDEAMAERLGDGVTPRAVSKWKYGERIPPLPRLLRIEEVTEGAVRPPDFVRGKDDADEPVPAKEPCQ